MTSSDKILNLSIAGLDIAISGSSSIDMLLTMNGFEKFISNKKQYMCEIRLDEALETNDFEPIYSFEFENIKCLYGNVSNRVVFTMTPSDTNIKPLILIQDNEFRISISEAGNQTLLRFALWTAFNLLGSNQNTFAFHSSCIVYNEKAILFTGESCAGKSTHTRLWYNNIPNASLLNDDSPIVRIEDDKVFAYGSPWSGKTPCYRAIKAEVIAIVRLGKALENKLERISSLESVVELHKSLPPMLSKDSNFRELEMSFLTKIINQIPIYKFDCLPELTAALMIKDKLFSNKIILDNKLVFSEIIKRIESGESVTIQMHGTSMMPLIANNDLITLSPIKRQIKNGDVALFKYHEKYLLHRVLQKSKNTITLRGDSSINTEQVERDDICAILTEIKKTDKKVIKCSGFSWQIKSFFTVVCKRIKIYIKSKK